MKTRTKKLVTLVCAAVMVCAMGQTALAADYPDETINLICHAAAGGGSDAMAREVAELLQDDFGWTVTVDNKTGGSGSVGMQYVMSSKPDGYTIGTAPVELSMIEALGYADINPDDVQLLACTMSWPAALYVSADSDMDTLDDFIAYCEENPGEVQVANSGVGSIWHISACVLADKTGIDIQHVPYDGATGALTALLGDEVEACVVGTCEGYTYVESGDLKCLASFSEERSDVLPDVPTTVEQGYDDVVVTCWVGLLAPLGMDDDVLNTLVDAIEEVVESDTYQEFCAGRGCDGTYYGPDEFYEMAKADCDYYSELITELGITGS